MIEELVLDVAYIDNLVLELPGLTLLSVLHGFGSDRVYSLSGERA